MAFAADSHAKIIVIGGGAIGCSVAYHLAKAGEKDVVLLEKALITEGATWHAAGLVGQLRSKRNLTRLMQNSVAVLDRLEGESGVATDWKKVGSIRLASSPERWSEIRRAMTQAKSFGLECHSLSAREAQEKFSFITTDGVVGAAFIPGDGYVDPYALTQSFAKAARLNGATIREGVAVKDIVVENRRAVGVVTDNGNISCDTLINCAGLWAKQVGEMAGVPLAAGVVQHQYFVTEKTLEFDASLPTLRDPDNNFYLKPDVAAFAIGGWEEGTVGCWRGRPPMDFGRELFEENYDRLEKFATLATNRLPILNETGIRTVINGPIPVSADGEPIMGLAPELDNFYVACGFTAGIAAAGGAGLAMANWIIEGDPGMDLWAFDVRRFGPQHCNGRYLEARAIEAYAAYYKIHWPGEEPQAGRPARRSPLYEILKSKGVVYGSKSGWERPNWFSADGKEVYSFEERPNWFDTVGRECKAVRERVAIIDQSSFSKFEVTGPGAFDFMQNLAANQIDPLAGKCTYTQLCNEQGGIEADLTIMHLAENRFYVVTGSGFAIRDGQWMRSHLPGDNSVQIRDVTSQWAVINLCGPNARKVLEQISDDDVSNDALPFLSVKEISLGFGHGHAARIGYVGELGWELHVPVEFAAHIYEQLWQAGEAHGIADVGYRAIESLRLEKGYLYWSSDISPDYNPYEAGLGFCVARDKDFIGARALEKIRSEGVSRKLVSFNRDGFAPFLGGEAILLNGEVIGLTTSAGYGHATGKSICFGYLSIELADETDFEIEAFGKAYAVKRGPRTLYDAKMERLKG
ncbi:Sarcosine dehydrogenase [hydrothermal vent metagenome]|uniref:Sarcosine dehydrogenase n=1 Tax=hydrothermal vent metagenome TaxID=652676 RepID=A0A3B0S1Z5_9ZZZZ